MYINIFLFFLFFKRYKVLKANTINLDIERFFPDEWVFFVDENRYVQFLVYPG